MKEKGCGVGRMKATIDFSAMKSTELLTLAKKAIREYNDVNLRQFKVVEK